MLKRKNTPSRSSEVEATWRALLDTFGSVRRVMDPYFTRFGISGSQWGVLRSLHRAESEGKNALKLRELSDRLVIRPPSVTGAIERLCRMGLVSRIASTSDQRVKLVSLSAEGRSLVERVLEGHCQQIAKLMAGLTASEQEQLRQLLNRLGSHLQNLSGNGSTALSSVQTVSRDAEEEL